MSYDQLHKYTSEVYIKLKKAAFNNAGQFLVQCFFKVVVGLCGLSLSCLGD